MKTCKHRAMDDYGARTLVSGYHVAFVASRLLVF
jgi:hypothetical protein